MESEIFAAVCAVESPAETNRDGSWSTGQGTGSDPDD